MTVCAEDHYYDVCRMSGVSSCRILPQVYEVSHTLPARIHSINSSYSGISRIGNIHNLFMNLLTSRI